MSLFNPEQEAHMRYLASIPAEQRCWNGWCLLPDRRYCSAPTPCPADVSLADRLVTQQPCCGRPAAEPWSTRTTGSHYAGCTERYGERFAVEYGLVDLGGEG